MPWKQCSICTAGAGDAVNRMLEKGTPLREISRLSGFGLATTHRHKSRCWSRRTLTKIRDRRIIRGRHYNILWRDEETGVTTYPDSFNPQNENVVITVEFCEAPIRNPNAFLTPAQLAEKAALGAAAKEEAQRLAAAEEALHESQLLEKIKNRPNRQEVSEREEEPRREDGRCCDNELLVTIGGQRRCNSCGAQSWIGSKPAVGMTRQQALAIRGNRW